MYAAPDDVIVSIIRADPTRFTAIRRTCRRFAALSFPLDVYYFRNAHMISRVEWSKLAWYAPWMTVLTALLDTGQCIYVFAKKDIADGGALGGFLAATSVG